MTIWDPGQEYCFQTRKFKTSGTLPKSINTGIVLGRAQLLTHPCNYVCIKVTQLAGTSNTPIVYG